MKVPPIIPVTDLRQDAASVLNQVRETNQPFVIAQRGRAAAVVLSVEAYEKLERDRELLLLLARGDKIRIISVRRSRAEEVTIYES